MRIDRKYLIYYTPPLTGMYLRATYKFNAAIKRRRKSLCSKNKRLNRYMKHEATVGRWRKELDRVSKLIMQSI